MRWKEEKRPAGVFQKLMSLRGTADYRTSVSADRSRHEGSRVLRGRRTMRARDTSCLRSSPSCESPRPEEGKGPLLWTLPLGRSANRGGLRFSSGFTPEVVFFFAVSLYPRNFYTVCACRWLSQLFSFKNERCPEDTSSGAGDSHEVPREDLLCAVPRRHIKFRNRRSGSFLIPQTGSLVFSPRRSADRRIGSNHIPRPFRPFDVNADVVVGRKSFAIQPPPTPQNKSHISFARRSMNSRSPVGSTF